jgi:hypothetical protein
VERSQDHQPDLGLVELQQACPLLLDGHVLLVVVKLGNLARRVRPVRPPGWLSLPAEVDRRVCPCLFQMVKRLSVVPVALVSLRAAWLLLPVAWLLHLEVSVLLLAAPDPVCLLRLAKLAVPQPEPLDPRQLLVAGSPLRARPRQLAEERSWDFQF